MKRNTALLMLLFVGYALVASIYYYLLYKKENADSDRLNQITFHVDGDHIVKERKANGTP